MKVGAVTVNIRPVVPGVAEIDFVKNRKSYFCMKIRFDGTVAKQYVSKLEENLLAPKGRCSAIFLEPPENEGLGKVTVELATRESDFKYINVEEPWSLKSKYIGHLIIEYPVVENSQKLFRYANRLVYKKDIIEELYHKIVELEPEAKSEIIESVLANGDLDSFYERIA